MQVTINIIIGHPPPFGLIFATFMVCIMIGSILFRAALLNKWKLESLLKPLLLVSAFSLVVPVFTTNNFLIFWSFNLFELCCGVWFPLMGTLRSNYVPEETRATIMNIFRFPLNLIVVTVLVNIKSLKDEAIFAICTACVCCGFFLSLLLEENESYDVLDSPPVCEEK